MIVSLIILGALVAAGVALYLHDRYYIRPRRAARGESLEVVTENPNAGEPAILGHREDSPVCCGMHVVCEKDSLSTAASSEIVYYDDEELDAFSGRSAESYSGAETEMFRDILFSLLPTDIAGWARSLQLRGIALPPDVRDELLLVVAEAREKDKSQKTKVKEIDYSNGRAIEQSGNRIVEQSNNPSR